MENLKILNTPSIERKENELEVKRYSVNKQAGITTGLFLNNTDAFHSVRYFFTLGPIFIHIFQSNSFYSPGKFSTLLP